MDKISKLEQAIEKLQESFDRLEKQVNMNEQKHRQTILYEDGTSEEPFRYEIIESDIENLQERISSLEGIISRFQGGALPAPTLLPDHLF
jgi:prefoldin subunit 5